ncbi:exonuclease SbcC [Christiangramia gaetbulicola]|uniref:Exonuclease SbcC n=1 Tax=Christiangramia gaetbulicola TaxID=703340 RepID=A0A2T6AIQ2_9FLAO|nr:AAA family ATPase [Christiangramia gaetbulicola]PTX43708.1 exonuclease SbcC [Christiangramia gaetbulicola]
MKILKVEFENINSLKGFHEIDFSQEPFLTNSLFAITGPTGSGKSSILDVISLALFNHVPRLGKITKNEIQSKGAILTRNQKNSMARVTYECNNGVYSSQWTIEINRNGNLNDYEMEIHDHHSGKLLDLKKSMVPNKNEELIGLNYDQFIKAVLLAQGEFAQFLKAKKEERGELLEKITGTGIYRRLGIKAFEKNKEANREIQEQQNEIRVIQNDLLEDEIIDKHEADLKLKTSQCETHQKEIEKFKKAIQLKDDIETQEKEILKQKQIETTATEELKKFDAEHGFPLKQHEKVQAEADQLRAWNQLRNNLKEAQETKEKISAAKKANLEQQTQVLKQSSGLVGESVTAETISDKLNSFREKVLNLQETRKNKLNSYTAKKDQLLSELRDTGIDFNEQDLEGSIATLTSELEISEKKKTAISQELKIEATADLNELQQKTRTGIKTAREAANAFLNIENLNSELQNTRKELEKDEKNFEQLPSKTKDKKAASESLRLQLQNAEQKKELELMKASLEDLRKKLKDGEACPLCGSEHHPYAHEQDLQDNDLDKEISALKAKSQSADKELHQLEAEFSSLQKRRRELQEKLQKIQQDQEKSKATFSNNYKQFENFDSRKEIEQVAEQLEARLEAISELENQVKKSRAIKNSIPLAKELKDIVSHGKALKKELDAIYTGSNIQNDVQNTSNTWIKLRENFSHYQERAGENEKQISDLGNQISKTEQHLGQFVSNTDFENIEVAWKALMPEAEASKLRQEKQQISKRIDDSRASIKLLNEQLERLKKLDSQTEKEKLLEQLEEKNTLFSSLSNECKELERKLKNQQERLKRMKELQEQIAEKEKQTRRWRLLNELIGDSKGKQFNDFAQDLTLSQLLKLANVRLQDLNDRYLIDKPEPEEDDGLVAIDEHMGGQRRSVKTLSGGETFILSLSMALALSDLASKNVEINSLFIDEGFGTLDPETLDQTLDTLEKLQAESSKTIGIISHVDSLKERISTQIKLTRNGQGYSSLSIK